MREYVPFWQVTGGTRFPLAKLIEEHRPSQETDKPVSPTQLLSGSTGDAQDTEG